MLVQHYLLKTVEENVTDTEKSHQTPPSANEDTGESADQENADDETLEIKVV